MIQSFAQFYIVFNISFSLAKVHQSINRHDIFPFFYTAGFSATNFTQWKWLICDIVHSRLNSVNALNISYLGFFIRNEINSIITVLREKTHKNLRANFAREYVVFWRNLYRQQKITPLPWVTLGTNHLIYHIWYQLWILQTCKIDLWPGFNHFYLAYKRLMHPICVHFFCEAACE